MPRHAARTIATPTLNNRARLLSKDDALNTLGLAMILVAAVALSGLTLWFYVQNRRKAAPPKPE